MLVFYAKYVVHIFYLIFGIDHKFNEQNAIKWASHIHTHTRVYTNTQQLKLEMLKEVILNWNVSLFLFENFHIQFTMGLLCHVASNMNRNTTTTTKDKRTKEKKSNCFLTTFIHWYDHKNTQHCANIAIRNCNRRNQQYHGFINAIDQDWFDHLRDGHLNR